MKRLTFVFYNLAPAGDPQRGPAFVERELRALANLPKRPWFPRRKVIAVVEAIHRSLPELPGYTLIRSTENLGRANVALYVLNRLKVGKVEWFDHEVTWPRTEHPGTHEARSTLVVEVEGWTVIVSHAPPGGRGTRPARSEWISKMVFVLRRAFFESDRPVLLLSDPNALGERLMDRLGPGHPKQVGPRDMVTGGTTIEAVHAIGVTLKNVRTPFLVRGVPMLSDHKKALIGRAVAR